MGRMATRSWRTPALVAALALALVACAVARVDGAVRASAGSRLVVLGQGSVLPPVADLQREASTEWCGSGETADNRQPPADPLAVSSIRVFYAYPADAEDRFDTVADAIVSDVAAIDSWWQGQDPTRRLRWDLYAFPGCAGGIASLDLGVLRLARDGAYYASANGFTRLLSEVAPHLGSTEKALVFYDGVSIDPRVCGVSDQAPRNGGIYGLSVVALESGCWVDLGSGNRTARIAVHELVHNLGAVPSKAPNRCGDASLGGHTCDGARDLMFPYASAGMTLVDAILDIDRNDYYGHTSEWWDVQDSAWLAHLPMRNVLVVVSGAGSVSSTPSVVTCPGTCTALLESDFSITFAATPGPGAEFYGWKGGCSGEGTCRPALTRDLSVQATFGPPRPLLTVKVAGKGVVTSSPAGLRCPGTCKAKYPSGTRVALVARPASGWRFARWSSSLGSKTGCAVPLTGDRTVTATFVRATK